MNRVYAVLFVMGIMLFGSVASAQAYVTTWDFDLDYGFTSWTVDEGSSSALPITASDSTVLDGVSGDRRLAWGDPTAQGNGQRSSIWFERKTGTVDTNGGLAGVTNLFHANYPILASSDILSSGVVRSVLTLTPLGGSDDQVFSTSFDFNFWETSNDGVYEEDIFLVASTAQSEFSFLYDDVEYLVSFMSSFNEVPSAALDDNGIIWPGTPFGWTTVENMTNEEKTFFSVSAAPVPEPSTFIIFGLGLLGIPLLRRFRRN